MFLLFFISEIPIDYTQLDLMNPIHIAFDEYWMMSIESNLDLSNLKEKRLWNIP